MQKKKGALLLLVTSDADAEACISKTANMNLSTSWHVKDISRGNLSYTTLTEEIALAGHSVEKFQEYMYDSANLSNAFEHMNQDIFHVAGHFKEDELLRLSKHENLKLWKEHISQPPVSAHVFKNIVESMISSFTSEGDNIETICPLLDKLSSGNVIIELRQSSVDTSLVDATQHVITLFKRVAEENEIEMILCNVKPDHNQGDADALFDKERCHMRVCSFSDKFNSDHLESVDSVTCLAKHLISHMSHTDINLLPVFTQQFSNCAELGNYGANICFSVAPDHISVYHIPSNSEDIVLEFNIAETYDIDTVVRNLSNQMDYSIHNLDTRERLSPTVVGGVPISRDFYNALPSACGNTVKHYDTSSIVQKNKLVHGSRIATNGSRGGDDPAVILSSVEESDSNAAATVELQTNLKLAEAKIAYLQNEISTQHTSLESCHEDVSALSSYSGPVDAHSGVKQLVTHNLIRSSQKLKRAEHDLKQLSNTLTKRESELKQVSDERLKAKQSKKRKASIPTGETEKGQTHIKQSSSLANGRANKIKQRPPTKANTLELLHKAIGRL